jgi:hypothetical protein
MGVLTSPTPSIATIIATTEKVDCMALSLSSETGIRAVLTGETEVEDEPLQLLAPISMLKGPFDGVPAAWQTLFD